MLRCSLFLSLFAMAGCAFGQVTGETNVSVGQTFGYVFITPYQPGDVGEWSAGSNDIASGQLAPAGGVGARGSVRFLVVGNTTVMCCLKPSGACGSLSNVMVHPAAPSVTPAIICNGGQVTVSADYQGTGGSDIRWYTSATGGSSIASGTQLTQTISSTTTYYAATYSALGGESLTRTAVTATVIMPPTMAPTVTGTECIGAGRPMTLHASGAGTGASYKWVMTTQVVSTSADYSISSPAATTSNYVSVSLTTAPGCDGPPTSVTVTVYPIPVIQGSAIAMGEPARLTCNADYDRYEWYEGANPNPVKISTTQTDNALLTDVPGTYVVKVFKGNATATSAPFVLGTQFDNQNLNYIVANTIQVSGVTSSSQVEGLTKKSKAQSVQYFDGLGRPMQTVVTQGSPVGNDMVQPIVYDEFGREKRKYLPVVVESKDGWYKPGIVNADGYTGIAASFYATPGGPVVADEKPYAETIFENSPLNRPLQQFGAGKSWYTNNKFIGHQYLVNVYGNGTGQEKIVAYQMDENGMLAKEPPVTGNVETGGYYSSDQLFIKCTVDEQGNTVREYTNKEEKVVLKKVQVVAGSTDLNNVNEWAFTYYVYDDFNNLVIVVPPEAVRILGN